jgi:hypothetical protein
LTFPKEQLLTQTEFLKACQGLYLIPDICKEAQLVKLYLEELDTAKTQKITMD